MPPKDGLLPRPHNARLARPGRAARWELGKESLADGLAAEVVYAGGGNALILFADEAEARETAYGLTRKALQEAPGLRLVLAHRPFAPGGCAPLSPSCGSRSPCKSARRAGHAPLLGLGVTAACDFTGAPAVGMDKDGRYISAEVAGQAAKPGGPMGQATPA